MKNRLGRGIHALSKKISSLYPQATIPSHWRGYLPVQDLIILKRLGMQPTGVIEVPVQSLFLQHHVDRPLEFLLGTDDGGIDRSILNSPHLKLLKTYESKGIEWLRENFRETTYYEVYAYYNQIGRKRNLCKPDEWITVRYEDKDIWQKIIHLINIYERIKREGYLFCINHG